MVRPSSDPGTDALFAELLAVGENAPRLRELLTGRQIDDEVLVAVLRRAVPVQALEVVATTQPWSGRPKVLAAVVANPRVPTGLALRLLPALFWRDLAEAARNPRTPGAVRTRAESLLREMLPDLRLGDRVNLGRIATPRVLGLLLVDGEPRVVRAVLENPRLREEDLLVALRQEAVARCLIEEVACSWRWQGAYAVRLTLVLQPNTTVPIALAQLTSLQPNDLKRIAESKTVAPIVRAAAARATEGRAGPGR